MLRKIDRSSLLAATLILSFLPVFVPAAKAGAGKKAVAAPAGNRTVEFEENRGQFPAAVRFLARAAGMNLFLTSDEAVYVMPVDCTARPELCPDAGENPRSKAHALRMKLIGANPEPANLGEDPTGHRTNYLRGAPEDHVTDVPNFGRVRQGGVYPGIDLVWHGLQSGATRFDFIVDANADPGRIGFEFSGAERISIAEDGGLLVSTPAGTLRYDKPFTFQERDGEKSEVASSFVIDGTRVGFALGEYDRSRPLTIDPTVNLNNVAFSTFLGGYEFDAANDIVIDQTGSPYVTGATESPYFPTTAGTFDTSHNANADVFVARLNPAGTSLIYSTYIGGTGAESGRAIALDSSGNACITGETTSPAFPTTAGAFDTTHNLSADAFVLKLNSTGTALVFSTFLGGSGFDEPFDITVDILNNPYVVGRTASSAFPTTASAFDTTQNGSNDVFLSKLEPNGTTLLYSTFVGGTLNDWGYSLAVDQFGFVSFAGFTSSSDFPTSAGAYDTTFNGGGNDAFITRINTLQSGASSLVFSTYLGGTDDDSVRALALDARGNVFVAGNVVNGGGFPTTPGAYDTTHNGAVDVFVAKLAFSGGTLVYSTYLGGSSTEYAVGLALDASGAAYVTGLTNDGVIDLPTTAGAFDTTHNGGQDVFLARISGSGSTLLYSTFVGGAANETGLGVALDENANVYLCGQTAESATNYPTTVESVQPAHGGDIDGFVTKFGDYSISGRVIDATTGAPLPSVMIALSGVTSDSMLTGVDGRFGFFSTVPFAPYAVSASRAGYSINPAVFNISSLNANRELIFVASVGSPTGGSGGTLRFENISYGKAENGGTVTATVKRIGDIQTTDPVTVDFTTANGTAVSGADFQASSGVITFNALETTKTVTIPLVNDGTLEPRESFSIELSNPTNDSEIEPNRGSAVVQIYDEDLSAGDLLIAEFRQRGRLGARDEYVKLFNPNDFDVTVQSPDGSAGISLVSDPGGTVTSVATVPNGVTIGARGHYLLTNNSPNGGFSLIDYPTGRGSTTAVGDQTFQADIPDNTALALVRTADPASFVVANALDSVAFGQSEWAEGKGLTAISADASELGYVRRVVPGGLKDTGNNQGDFLLVDNRATVFEGSDQTKVLAVLGAPAPGTSESLPLLAAEEFTISGSGIETYDPTPVPNGPQGTLTVYRTLTNNGPHALTALRLRAVEFPTTGAAVSSRYSSRPDFRLASSVPEGAAVATSLAAGRLQPNGGGINSTLSVDSVTAANPLLPGQSVVVAIRFTVVRYGRHPLTLAAEGGE
jgi:hypothetical protein